MSLYRNINKRKKAGTSRSKRNPLYQLKHTRIWKLVFQIAKRIKLKEKEKNKCNHKSLEN